MAAYMANKVVYRNIVGSIKRIATHRTTVDRKHKISLDAKLSKLKLSPQKCIWSHCNV